MTSSEPEPEPDVIIAYVAAIVILIFLSAFFSATETAYSSLNRARLKVKAADGGKNAALALNLSEKFDDVLFTLLIGNNIVNITASTVATLLFVKLINASAGPAVSTTVLTITVLIFGEIFPKLIAKNAPERFAIVVAPVLKFFMVVLFPLCIIFKGLKKLFSKIFKLKPEESITDEELKTIVEEASEDGVIEEGESELIHNAIDFHDCEVGDILVPRVNVEAVEISMPMNKIKTIFKNSGYSRLPVYDGTIDKIIGMIHEKDFTAAFDRGDGNVKSIIKKMAIATEHMRISTLLKSMQKARVHMANVVDEYGGTLGIVTLEDILEELVGEIWDEHDEIIDYFEKTGDGKYLVDGNASLEDFFELFDISPDKYNFDSQTVSGWVIEQIGDLPKKNANFEFENLKIIVTRCSQKMVYEIKVLIKDASEVE
ncbi:MAG: HlyC/CorC family transporter [Christensenellaceae bacterium]